jgi:N-acetyl-alpha-D-muramate 1-phosphate uridylyltransferase
MSLPVAILAGGLAKRLRPLTEIVPKALADVQGEPFIAHQLRLLSGQGTKRVILCAGYRGEMIQDVIGNGARYGVHVEFSFDWPNLLGTAGAIKKAISQLEENFFVLYGDSYLPCDYRKVQAAFEEDGRLALMTVFRNDGRWDRSNVEFKDGKILSYDKKNQTPQMSYIDYGLGVFNQAAFHMVPDNQPHDLAILYQNLLKQKELAGYEVRERFYEVGSFEGLEEFRHYVAEHGPDP